jgi:hypothetical protein
MALFSRWVRPPAELRSMFEAGERLLAVAETDAGPALTGAGSALTGAGTEPTGAGQPTSVLATPRGLWIPAGSTWRLIRWSDVVRAAWSETGLQLVEGVTDTDGIVTDLDPVEIGLSQPRNLPAVVRARVEASLARSEQVFVAGASARLVARRVAGQDGVLWTGRLDSGMVDTPGARALLVAQVARARQCERSVAS